jgi:hypothetical protein
MCKMKGQSNPRYSDTHKVLLFVHTKRAVPIVTERKEYDIIYVKRGTNEWSVIKGHDHAKSSLLAT